MIRTHIEVTLVGVLGTEDYKILVPLATLILEKASDTITIIYDGIDALRNNNGIAVKESYEEIKAMILGTDTNTESVIDNLPVRDFISQPITETDIGLKVYSEEFGKGRVSYYDSSISVDIYPIGVVFVNNVKTTRSYTVEGIYVIENHLHLASNIQPWVE